MQSEPRRCVQVILTLSRPITESEMQFRIFESTGGVDLRAPESIVKTTCGFLCSYGQRSAVHPHCTCFFR
jgi:hypothetical protein